MALVDDLSADTEQRPPWQVCSVRWVMDQVDPADGIALSSAIDDTRVAGRKIEEAVWKNLGLRLAASTIHRHRRGLCRCSR